MQSTPITTVDPALEARAMELLRQNGNPFRNYFARNPDDEICSRYHVPELFAGERDQLLEVVDLYRRDLNAPSEVVPVLGNKGAGKTHLLHSIKHGHDAGWQMLVTPGLFQRDSDFLEYLLFQIIDTLLGGGRQRGVRPLELVSQLWTRRLLLEAIEELDAGQKLELFPASGLGRWARKLGLGNTQVHEKIQWLCEQLQSPYQRNQADLRRLCTEVNLEFQSAFDLVAAYVADSQTRDTAGMMRWHLFQGFARAALLNDEGDIANFLTNGFADLEYQVRPSRQDLVLALFKTTMQVFLDLKIPVVVAFDQLEDLLLVRRTDDGRRTAEAFFAGIVQAMHQINGLCFLIFAERGVWNRFVPSLDGYIQDRLNNPVHLVGRGSVKTLRLEAPPSDLVRRVVESRLRPALEDLADPQQLPSIYPFTEEQVERIARTEPTVRDMLQQFRHLFDHLVFGTAEPSAQESPTSGNKPHDRGLVPSEQQFAIKSVTIVETPAGGPKADALLGTASTPSAVGVRSPNVPAVFDELWNREMQAAREQLEPSGSLTGATRELQAGLGAFLQACNEHGVKVGPWRLKHVVGEWTFGDHPTYGVVTIAHWACKDSQPWKVGIGLFLGRGSGKPRDLETKLSALQAEPPLIDHLILVRPEDDLNLSGKSKQLWLEAERRGRHARLEALRLEDFAVLYAFPRWLSAISATLPEGQPLPNLADLIQFRCEKLLEQVCMPVQQ